MSEILKGTNAKISQNITQRVYGIKINPATAYEGKDGQIGLEYSIELPQAYMTDEEVETLEEAGKALLNVILPILHRTVEIEARTASPAVKYDITQKDVEEFFKTFKAEYDPIRDSINNLTEMQVLKIKHWKDSRRR